MSFAPALSYRGMGAASPIVNMGTQAAGIATSALMLIPAAGPFAPFAALGVGLFSLLSNVFGLGSGCGQTCIQATRVVDQVEPYLKQNVQAYMNGGHTAAEQATALQIFDAAWADVVKGCSQPALGDAGKRCISERQAGGSAPWCPTGTGCDWFILYRNPIANDPNVVTLANGQVVNVSPASLSAPGFDMTPLLVIGGLLAAAIIVPRFI